MRAGIKTNPSPPEAKNEVTRPEAAPPKAPPKSLRRVMPMKSASMAVIMSIVTSDAP
jgi:hypothetical protein